MAFLALSKASIHYEVAGSGFPVLMFAPGFLSSRMERWWTNPAKPGIAQPWADPIPVLKPHFTLILLDVRNAGLSRAAVGPADDWDSYTQDHIALLDHLGITQCHTFGACIGVSFALSVAKAQPDRVTSLVLQNPIGLSGNRDAIEEEYEAWVARVETWPEIDRAELPPFGRRMFGGEFLFSVSREDVAACDAPMLLMPGNDTMHPAATSADIVGHARRIEIVENWKGPDHRDVAMERVRDFLLENTPA
jgi:pimeloyl-ACP methyl ester carboxylesterase